MVIERDSSGCENVLARWPKPMSAAPERIVMQPGKFAATSAYAGSYGTSLPLPVF